MVVEVLQTSSSTLFPSIEVCMLSLSSAGGAVEGRDVSPYGVLHPLLAVVVATRWVASPAFGCKYCIAQLPCIYRARARGAAGHTYMGAG